MGNSISTRKRSMILKKEAARGTFVTWPGSWADADFDIRFFNIQLNPEVESLAEKFATGDHDMVAAVMGRQKCTVTCSAWLRWGGTNDVAPNISKVFHSLGLLETVSAGVSVTWQPDKSADLGGGLSGALDLPFDIVVQDEVMGSSPGAIGTLIRGTLGNAKIKCDQMGQPWILELEYIGVLEDIVDIVNANILALTSPETAQADVFLSSTITAAATVQKISKFEHDLGNVIELEGDPSDPTGYLAAMITDREPKFGMDPRTDLLANDAKFTRWKAGTEAVIGLATSHFALDADKSQLLTMAEAQRIGIQAYDEAYSLNRDDTKGYPWILTQT